MVTKEFGKEILSPFPCWAVANPNLNSLLTIPFLSKLCSLVACCNISISADHGHTKRAGEHRLKDHQKHNPNP